MTFTESLTIAPHVTGYPGVAFGGYVAGLLAARSDAAEVRVDFRAAVPVGTGLLVAGGASEGTGAQPPVDGAVVIRDAAGTDLAVATPAPLTLDAPEPPTWAQAEKGAAAQVRSLRRNPPPVMDCYGCGPDVSPGQGLKLLPGRVEDRPDLLAGAWIPEKELAGPDGVLPPEIVWAALDCPGGWTAIRLGRMPLGGVTARLTGTQLAPVRAGEPHISYAWMLGAEGRKTTVGVAVATAEGELCALAEALWITPRGVERRVGE
ncbi:hypothetical protein ACIBI4_28795 [Streptomyces sp. NPDC050418]|uniref:hypothetical protein n=1 Tax=Streptomyces sp. NPDC050418 TaxID=3365612 RepID=UPI0037A9FAC1